MKKRAVLWVAGIFILFTVFNYEQSANLFQAIGKALYPVFIGIIIAFTINAPVKVFEKTVFSSKKLAKVRRLLSLTTTVVIFAGVITAIYFVVVPEIRRSIDTLAVRLPEFNAESLKEMLQNNKLLSYIAENVEKVIDQAAEKLNGLLPKAVDFVANTVKMIINIFLGIVFGGLIISNKEKLASQLGNLLLYFTDADRTKKIMAALSLAGDKFSKFLSGQLVEAIIFGVICYIVFLIFKIPYAVLAAFIMALGNLIPILGAYIAGGVVFIFVLTASVPKAIVFIIVIIVLQQIEQVTTYPVIVGKYVGISSFWILFAVIVGGSLFGFWGLLLSVPLVAFCDHFFKVVFDKKMKEERKKEQFTNGA